MRKKYRKKRATKLKKRKGKRRKRLRKKSRNRFAKIGRKKEREKKERIRGWNGDKFDSLPLRRGKLEILFLVQGKGMGKCEICKIEDGDDGDFAVIKCIFQPINIWNIKFQRKWWEGYMSLSRIACVAVIFAYFFSSFSYALLRSCATSASLKRAETTATQEKAAELLLSMSQWYGHPYVLGVPIPKTLLIWASPGNLTRTLTQIARVIWEGDAHVTRVLGMEMAKMRGCPYHCNTGL